MPNTVEVAVVVCAEAEEASLVSERKANDDLLERVTNQWIIDGHSEVDIEAEKDVPLEVALVAEKEVAILADALQLIMKTMNSLKEMIAMIIMKIKTEVKTKEAEVEEEAEAEAEAEEFRCPALL
jgi:hypothetical protein